MTTSHSKYPDDHALIIGIDYYPGIFDADGRPSQLDGPPNDTKSIREWLISESGGGLDQKNVRVVERKGRRSKTARKAEPSDAAIVDALKDIEELTRERAGRRLYIYASGHGFSPRDQGSALITANFDDAYFGNVWLSDCMRYFRVKKRFEEFVLWTDCCGTSLPDSPPANTHFIVPRVSGKLGPQFLAFGAPEGQEALECAMTQDGNRVHGVFTWTLLQGLKHAALDPATGTITGATLRDYIYGNMKGFLPERERSRLDIASQAYIDAGEGQLTFGAPIVDGGGAVPPVEPSLNVVFAFPRKAEGAAVRIFGGNPLQIEAEGQVLERQLEAKLDPGLHVVEVAREKLRQGICLSGSERTPIKIEEKGDPVAAIAGRRRLIELEISADVASVSLHVMDARLSRKLETIGGGTVRLPSGVYMIRAQFGREVVDTEDRIVLLDGSMPKLRERIKAPGLRSPLPLDGSERTHEYQVAAMAALSGSPDLRLPDRGGTSESVQAHSRLALLARYWTSGNPLIKDVARYPHPFEGLSIIDRSGKIVINETALLESAPEMAREGGDLSATFVAELAAGTYTVRQQLESERTEERSIKLIGKWSSEFVIRRSMRDLRGAGGRNTAAIREMGDVAMRMQRPNRKRDLQIDRMVEGVRLALRDRRSIRANDLDKLLLAKFADPIAGLMGALLTVTQALKLSPKRRRKALGVLDEVVPNLRKLLGDDDPDVAAISILCPDKTLRTERPIVAPPMFARSWAILLDSNVRLIPPEIKERCRVVIADPLYHVWVSDQAARKRFDATAMRQDAFYAKLSSVDVRQPVSGAGARGRRSAARDAATESRVAVTAGRSSKPRI